MFFLLYLVVVCVLNASLVCAFGLIRSLCQCSIPLSLCSFCCLVAMRQVSQSLSCSCWCVSALALRLVLRASSAGAACCLLPADCVVCLCSFFSVCLRAALCQPRLAVLKVVIVSLIGMAMIVVT